MAHEHDYGDPNYNIGASEAFADDKSAIEKAGRWACYSAGDSSEGIPVPQGEMEPSASGQKINIASLEGVDNGD